LFDQDLNNIQHMQLTSTIWIDPYAIMQPFPEEESRLDVAIRPFQLMVSENDAINFYSMHNFFLHFLEGVD